MIYLLFLLPCLILLRAYSGRHSRRLLDLGLGGHLDLGLGRHLDHWLGTVGRFLDLGGGCLRGASTWRRHLRNESVIIA